MVVGRVKPKNVSLKSSYNSDATGVIRVLELKEHGTSWRNNIISDTTRTITRTINDVPFSLVNDKYAVSIIRPLDADYLVDSFQSTYNNFEPSKESFATRLLNTLIANEQVRGIETNETMLLNDTQLTAFGKLELLPSKELRLSEPTKSGTRYIITSLNRLDLIEKLDNSSKTIRVWLWLLGALGVGLGAYCGYKLLKSYAEKRRLERMKEEAKQMRLKQMQRARQAQPNEQSANNNNNNGESTTCVVCLTNPREIVLIECGHVCLCLECLEQMPNRTCPVCRQQFTSYVPCYFP